jgi:hypothetical protein
MNLAEWDMQATRQGTSEVAIFGRVLEPERANLSVAAARSILALEFAPDDMARMRLLLDRAKKGELDDEEQVDIDNYERVGHLISLMKSKARRSLKTRAEARRKAKPG